MLDRNQRTQKHKPQPLLIRQSLFFLKDGLQTTFLRDWYAALSSSRRLVNRTLMRGDLADPHIQKKKSILQITIWEQGWGPREESDLVEQNVHYVPCSRADRWRRRLFVATSCSHIRCTSVDALKDVVRRISALKCWVSSDVQTQRTPRVCSRLRSVYLITCCLNSWERVRKVSASKPRTIWPPDIS